MHTITETLACLLENIKTTHLEDLGIPIEWEPCESTNP